MNTLMSSVTARASMPRALLCLFALATAQPASAAGFGERLRGFVLGAEAPASARPSSLDARSQACLQCHDGSRASPVTVRAAGSELPIQGARTLNHPVGMVYDHSVAKDPQGYKTRATLHPNIRLVDGRVGCVSCHQVRGDLTVASGPDTHVELPDPSQCTATKQLTMGPRDLCLACHNK